jgi:hypothetical protein
MMLIAAATLSLSALAGAAAPNAAPGDANRAPSRPADMVLAAAETVRAPVDAQAQPPAAPVKKVRVARVTTCRCGDQVPQTTEE